VKLTSQFVVDVPLERTWSALLDVPGVASALPGANDSTRSLPMARTGAR
jgi:carbon monoxide dehydrogenase subunit G